MHSATEDQSACKATPSNEVATSEGILIRGFNGHVVFGLLILGNDRFDKVQTELTHYFDRLGIV